MRRDAAHEPVSAKELAIGLSKRAWRRVTWREGSNTPLASRFAAVCTRPDHRDYWRPTPRLEECCLIEWPTGKPESIKYWLATLPDRPPRHALANLNKLRWRIECDHQDLKQGLGLGHYEGRGWRDFHHHATLCIAAHGVLHRRTGDDSPLRSMADAIPPATYPIRRLPTPRRCQSGLNTTSLPQ